MLIAPLAVDTYLLNLGVSGDSILGIFARENTSTYWILHLPLGVTNEGFEAHQGVFSGAVAGDSTLQDRGVALSFTFAF